MTHTQSRTFLRRDDYSNSFNLLGRTYPSIRDAVLELGECSLYAAVYAKFSTHAHLATQLLATDDLEGPDAEVFTRVKRELSFFKKEEPPTLQEAILNNPDAKLAKACRELFENTDALMSMYCVRMDSFSPSYVSQRLTTAGDVFTEEDAKASIESMKKTRAALANIKALLKS
jgi:hypothetical protein